MIPNWFSETWKKSFIGRNLLGIKLWYSAECGSFWSWVDLSWVISSNLEGGSFWTCLVGHFGQFSEWAISVFGCFGQSLKVIIICVCIIICVWMDRLAGLKFCEKIRLKCKKGPFTTQAETIHVKIPLAGPKRPVTITVWLREIKRIYRENNSKTQISEQFNIFWDNSQTTFFLDLELKIIKVSVN